MAATTADSAANNPRFRHADVPTQLALVGEPVVVTASPSPSTSPSPPPPPPSTEIHPPELSDPDGNGSKEKKPVWRKPSIEGATEAVPPVIDASSWPELSQAVSKASSKPSPESSLKVVPDGSAPLSPGPVPASSPQRPRSNNNTNPHLNSNHAAPTRQRSMRRGGGPANGGGHGPVLPSPPPPTDTPHGIPERSPSSAATLEVSPREHPNRGNNWGEHGQRQNHFGGGDGHRNSHRRNNYGHFHGNRREHDRDWNSNSRSFNGRDFHMQNPRNIQRAFVGHMVPPLLPAVSAPFMAHPIGPPPLPYGLGIPGEMAQYYIPRPFVYPGPMPMAHPPVDPLLISLTAQIDYYFSDENLIKDVYLKQHMDGQGWVPISLIAGFNRVKQMTTDIQIILNAVRASTIVEVKDGKIRRRAGWAKWILPSMNHVGNLAASCAEHGTGGGIKHPY
ncbi:hypothetical protein QJS10_CPB11g02021 [Acorus calamus]|uniref:HTH La-type RNA-binding domain-containing protein n=1 Tax=Acorus calamus TaxID=4465 RepID=A0AAV9DWX0_ACOCL|nr:hypothetical protein QJS10_CPB11g02021 [Acorus calamus]